jgi:hypothetical protein
MTAVPCRHLEYLTCVRSLGRAGPADPLKIFGKQAARPAVAPYLSADNDWGNTPATYDANAYDFLGPQRREVRKEAASFECLASWRGIPLGLWASAHLGLNYEMRETHEIGLARGYACS